MNNASHQFTTDAKPWDYASGVSDCDTCDGSGQVVRFPRGAYMLNPLEWQEDCEDCTGLGVHSCPTCGFSEVVQGYDCAVCALVHDLSPANMKRISPADLADAFAQAVNAALNAEVTP